MTIPNSVISIVDYAFHNFNGTSLILGSSLQEVGYVAFENYVGTGQTLIIPSSVTIIEFMAFNSFSGNIQTYIQTLCDSVGSWAPNATSCTVIND